MNFLVPIKQYHTVYISKNLITGTIYVGVHTTHYPNDDYLGSGTLLKRAVNFYGRENFGKYVFAVFDNEKDAYKLESKIVDDSFLKGNVYNLNVGGYGGFSFCNTDYINKKKSIGLKGKPKSAEHRKKISDSNKNKKRSAQTREKMAIIQNSTEYKENLRKKLKGRVVSRETREKLSVAMKNRPPASLETRKKISEKLKGRKQTKEEIEKRAAKLRGRKMSAEAREKMRMAWKHRAPPSEETKQKQRAKIKGRIFLKNVDLNLCRLVYKESDEYYELLSLGFVRGKLQGHKK